MLLQKDMLAEHYRRLEAAPETGEPVVYTFVPGNLTELIRSFGALPVLPEINALQSAMRGKSQGYIAAAEKAGHSEDVCSYVKCDLGMLKAGNVSPTGTRLPKPDLLLLSYTGCYTFMKWFELLREEYRCPMVFLQIPYQGDGAQSPAMRSYVARQIRESLIPALEKATGRRFDEERLRENLRLSAAAEDDLVAVLQSAKKTPSPIDAYFGAVYYVGPIFSAFRGTEEGAAYYRTLRQEVEGRVARGEGPMTPAGRLDEQKYRLVVEGPPNWTHFREFWRMFADEGAVVVASTYSKVGGTYDFGFRHDPADPLGTLADYCSGCYTNLQPAVARRDARALRRGVPGRRVPDPLGQVLQLVLGRAAADAARGGDADRNPGRVHRVGSRRPALLLGRQSEEPPGELLPDARGAPGRKCRRELRRRHRSRLDDDQGRGSRRAAGRCSAAGSRTRARTTTSRPRSPGRRRSSAPGSASSSARWRSRRTRDARAPPARLPARADAGPAPTPPRAHRRGDRPGCSGRARRPRRRGRGDLRRDPGRGGGAIPGPAIPRSGPTSFATRPGRPMRASPRRSRESAPACASTACSALYDKCIIRVENEPVELGFREHIGKALDRAGEHSAAFARPSSAP